MKIQYLLPGLFLAFVGFVLLFGLLASVSALAKSKQIGALGALASGKAGGAKRALFAVAAFAMLFGACGALAGVAISDGDRAGACQRTCVDRGYAEGKIGASRNPDPKRPMAACVCSGGANAATPFEVRVDELEF